MSKKKIDRPKYIIKVTRDWRYGPRARFWDIQRWHEDNRHAKGGWWVNACKGGIAYTEWGMWRAINKSLKKMQFGSHKNYFTLDKKEIDGIF
jgi:hypothetical protein